MPPSLSQPLSSLIHRKTGGIILFTKNFIKSLQEIGLLHFSLSTLSWQFDVHMIGKQEMSNDIVHHLAERILRQPQSVLLGLQIAACLGPTFDLETYTKADSKKGLSVEDFIYTVTESGFISENSPGQYTWNHDKILEAAYSLIPRSGLESLHLLVGTRIYIKTKSEDLYDNIHIIVRNMNMGLRSLDADHLRKELAHLNLMAGSKSAEQSAFNSAVNYFMIGVGLLGDHWHLDSYKLGMKLFNAAVEGLLVTGNTSLFRCTIDTPITFAENLEDRLPSSYTFVRFLASTGEIDEAMTKCFSILREIGEDFPTEVTPQIIYAELVKTKEVLSKYSQDNFSCLPKLEAPMKKWSMEFMQITCRVAFCRKTDFIPLIACRIVQLSDAHGWAPTSAFGLSSFGHGLISVLNEIDAGHEW
jgi:predicted ATPase